MDQETGPATLGLNLSKEIVKEKKQLKTKLEENKARCNANFVVAEALNEALKEENEGDLIEFERDNYAHWGVFVGGGYVIHVVDARDGKAKIRRQKLVDIGKNCRARVNNLSESAQRRELNAGSVDDILQAAFKDLNKDFKYDLFENNCEHFATRCRYGEGFSDQAKATEGMSIIPSVGPVLAKYSIIVAGCTSNFS